MKKILIVLIFILCQTRGWSQQDASIEILNICKSKKKVTLVFDLVNGSDKPTTFYMPKDFDACFGLIKLYSENINQERKEIPICDYVLDIDDYKLDSTNFFELKKNERKKIKIDFKHKMILDSFEKIKYRTLYLEINFNLLRNYFKGENLYLKSITSQKKRV